MEELKRWYRVELMRDGLWHRTDAVDVAGSPGGALLPNGHSVWFVEARDRMEATRKAGELWCARNTDDSALS